MIPNIDIKTLKKLYYSIGEVADMFQINQSLIRFWEKEFPIIQPRKNSKGNRSFTPKDIEIFNKIYHLVKIQGFTLDGAKNELKKKNKATTVAIKTESDKLNEVVGRLEKIKLQLLTMKNEKDSL